jgi:hypothetical protein
MLSLVQFSEPNGGVFDAEGTGAATMTMEKWINVVGDLGTLVAVAALLLAIWHNTRELRRSSYHAMVGMSVDLLKPLYLNEGGILDVWLRINGLKETNSDADKDRWQWHFFMMAAFRHFDNLIYQHKIIRALDDKMWPSYKRSIESYMQMSGFDDWYNKNQWAFSDLLKELVEELRARPNQNERSSSPPPN